MLLNKKDLETAYSKLTLFTSNMGLPTPLQLYTLKYKGQKGLYLITINQVSMPP